MCMVTAVVFTFVDSLRGPSYGSVEGPASRMEEEGHKEQLSGGPSSQGNQKGPSVWRTESPSSRFEVTEPPRDGDLIFLLTTFIAYPNPPRPTLGSYIPPRPSLGPSIPPRPTLEPSTLRLTWRWPSDMVDLSAQVISAHGRLKNAMKAALYRHRRELEGKRFPNDSLDWCRGTHCGRDRLVCSRRSTSARGSGRTRIPRSRASRNPGSSFAAIGCLPARSHSSVPGTRTRHSQRRRGGPC